MAEILYKLPAVIILAAVVATFVSLYRNNRSPHTRLWLAAWVVMLLRTSAQAFGPIIISERAINAFDLAALELSGMLFFLSGTKIYEVPRLRAPLLITLTSPAILYAVLFGYSVEARWIYLLLLASLAIGALCWILFFFGRTVHSYSRVILWLVVLTCGFAFVRIWQGRYDLGYYSIETLTFTFGGMLFWRRFRRFTPGVLLCSLGFIAWASIFPTLYALQGSSYILPVVELANVPKILVALGMIVTLLEEESISASVAREQERATRQQLQRFFDVTSRLLSGVEVSGICNHVAQVITDSSNFRHAVILLTDDQRTLYAAGASGIDAETAERIQATVSKLTVDVITKVCPPESKFGANSFITSIEKLQLSSGRSSESGHENASRWKSGDEVIVPLRSPRGVLFGCISLDEPKDVDQVRPEDLYAVELLAADLAVAIENANLQKQLVRSEKLAGIGQLVSGAAHELNNPLTAVLGYTEMLTESAHDDTMRRDLGVIRREAMRMKQIIENLLRFARQTKFERKTLSLASVIDDVLKLRAYELRSQGVQLTTNVAVDLPGVMVEENLLKQVFLNILNNALDAVANLDEKKIVIEAAVEDRKVVVRFSDNGPGITDLDRVFDPFFTTKSPGKGTGLGLSICYGIIKEHAGDITAYNLHPNGACIAIELPAAGAATEMSKTVSALSS
jgi:two-component system NtrC family sensor kinase